MSRLLLLLLRMLLALVCGAIVTCIAALRARVFLQVADD